MRLRFLIAGLVLFSLASRAQTLQTALDAPNLTWTTNGAGGARGWIGQTTTSHDGVSAAETVFSPPNPSHPANQIATLQTTVAGPGTLTFWWMGSTPDVDNSKFSFRVGGSTLITVPDGAPWTQQTIYLGAGSQTLQWVYVLPAFVSVSSPGYVDQVTWTSGATAPLILTQPFSQSIVPGLNATFSVNAGGTPPLSFQWQFNGTNIPNATNASCTIPNVQPENLGPYHVIISNNVSTAISADASLEFGEVAAWGYNTNTDNRGTAPLGATNVLQISGGWQQNILIRKDGSILNWGDTNFAQATLVATSSNALHGSALNTGGVILNSDGTITAWGNSGITNVPPDLTNVIAIAQGPTAAYCLALKADGSVVGWGDTTLTNIPASVTNVVSIAAGESHCLALKADGTIIGWGDNSLRQLSAPLVLFNPNPTNRVVAIAAGAFHSLALRADGKVFAWGLNNAGQTNVPFSAQGSMGIAAGSFHSIALRTDGTVVAWGQSLFGQTSVPAGLSNVVAISAGANHGLALVGSGPPAFAASSNHTYSTNTFSLSIPSQSGRIFELDYKNSLTDANWTLLPYAAGNGTNLILTDPTATNAQRFYRVRRW